MKDRAKKIISMLAATTVLGSTLAFAACGEEEFTGKKLNGYVSSQNAAVSNGGFAVQKDNYVYYVNGAEDYSASNKYGKVKKGALMRISTTDLEQGNYENTQTVVPMLLVSQDYDSGIYIYGDYVYYATPTTDKDVEDGKTRKDWIDFKRAKLDGSSAMSDYYFRLEDNSANFRYVEENGVVYCMYEDDGALKSFNTKTEKTHVLVEGASNLTYDMKDLSNGTVYYTMGVTFNLDSESSNAAPYNQIYKVSASATAKSIANGYETSNGKKYTFDTYYLEDNYKGFKEDNYKTYPYVNLGELVLDGIGSNYTDESSLTQYNESGIDFSTTSPKEISGYTYTVTRNDQGGVYFTRLPANNTEDTSPLYYLASGEDGKNTVTRNDGLVSVAKDASKVSSAYFYGVDDYIVLSDSTLVRSQDGEEVSLAYNMSGITLWKTEGEFLYYYATGANGYNLSRINYTADLDKLGFDPYNPLIDNSEYDPITFAYVDWNSSWYKPEFFGGKLLYSGAQSLGSTAYKYIYAIDVPQTNAELEKMNEKYKEVQDFFADIEDSDHKNAMKYVFGTGEKTLLDEVESLYEAVQIADYTAFAAHAKNESEDVQNGEDYAKKFKDENGEYYDRLSYYVALVGGEDAIKSKDKDAIKASWASTLPSETETTEEEPFPVWAIILIVAGSVIVVAAAVAVPVVLHVKKKAARRAAIESTRVRRPRLDTTDDKTIDVYADDEEEQVEETPASVEETPVETAETEEPVEAPIAEEAAESDENKAE